MLGVERESNGWRAYALELWVESRERVADELCARADCFARLGFVEEAERDRYVAGRLRNEPISIEQRQRSFGGLCSVAQGHHSLPIGVTASPYDVGSNLSKSPT